MVVSPSSLGDVRINGSSPTRKVAKAIPMTIQPAVLGREPGKTSSSQVAPNAVAQMPSTPIRWRTESGEPDRLETKTSRPSASSRYPKRLEGRPRRQARPPTARVVMLATRTAANAVGSPTTPPVATIAAAADAAAQASTMKAKSALCRRVPDAESCSSSSGCSNAAPRLTAERFKGTTTPPRLRRVQAGCHRSHRVTRSALSRAGTTSPVEDDARCGRRVDGDSNAKGRVREMALKHEVQELRQAADLLVAPLYSLEAERIPRHTLTEDEMPPDVAYQIVHDELMLDGNARLNVATFVSTWMEPQAERLMAECLDKNMIDKDEYPQTAALETRCVNILANLWHAPEQNEATGCSTTGSSEAAMLAGLALKRRWRKQRLADGMPGDKPNIVMGGKLPGCWEKV